MAAKTGSTTNLSKTQQEPKPSFDHWAWMPVKQLLGLSELERKYAQLRKNCRTPLQFVNAGLAEFSVELLYSREEQARIPDQGGFIVVANHPFGMLEGLLLGKLLLERRPDVRILTNHLLAQVPELHDLCIFVDPWSRPSSRARNAAALKQALRHLRQGGLLAVFPAGEVAHRTFGDRGELHDAPWQASIGQLIQRSGAPVLPIHFCGENSLAFQLAGMVHPSLRTALLPRELLNKQGKRVEVRIGQPVQTRKLRDMSAVAFTAYLQERSEILQHRAPAATRASVSDHKDGGSSAHEVLAEEIPAERLAAELAALPPERCLLTHGNRQVFMAKAQEFPQVLLELGRLRQLAFRAVGEGTDEPRDLDRFDPHYHHLLVWDERDQAIIGAYRVGLVDEILPHHGREGLYIHTLFDVAEPFFSGLCGGALELGRSFVAPRYQRDATGLMLLWKGIGAFVARHPHYRYLYGPCSISDNYTPMSRRLLLRYLEREHGAPTLSRHVRARIPLTRQPRVDAALPRYDRWMTSLAEVSNWVTHLEADQKRIPVLVRQYLGIGGRILGFNVDPAFKSVVDCFVLVDLLSAKDRALSMFMGAEKAKAYLGHQRAQAQSQTALGRVA